MPIFATPLPTETVLQTHVACPPCAVPSVHQALPLASVSCYGQNLLSATVSTQRGKPVLSRMRSITITAGQEAVIDWKLHDKGGNPVDVTCCLCPEPGECVDGSLDPESASSESSQSSASPLPSDSSSASMPEDCDYSIQFRMLENISLGCDRRLSKTYTAEIVDKTTGHVRVTIPPDDTRRPGVYFGEMAFVAKDAHGHEAVYFSNTFYVLIQNGNFRGSKRHDAVGPPMIAEVRLHLRDAAGGEDNFLLDNVKFDDAEIMLAATRAVQYWNEFPPDVKRYTTANFPYRFHWLEAISGYLFLMAAEHYRANNLAYSAAGVSVNDMDKEPNYERAAEGRLAAWKEFVTRKKAEINLNNGFGGVGSSYGWRH